MRIITAFTGMRWAAMVALATMTVGCSLANEADDPKPPPQPPAGGSTATGGSGGSTATGGSGGNTATGGSGGNTATGGSGGAGGAGGSSGGAGGGGPAGRPGMAVVAGGGLVKSANHVLWFSVGESPGGTGKTQTSTNYRHESGVIATTQP